MRIEIHLKLKWDGEGADEDVGGGQVGDEQVRGVGPHVGTAEHHVHDLKECGRFF